MNNAIHISHEAAKKIGGIGSVLSGLCTAKTYTDYFDRTIFYGPLFDDTPNPQNSESIATERIGGNGKVLYSSLDNIASTDYAPLFIKLCQKYSIDIVYGEKKLYDEIDPNLYNNIEILLIGIKRINTELLNKFKFRLWDSFKFSCQLFENDWDFEEYLRIAVPFRELTVELISALPAKAVGGRRRKSKNSNQPSTLNPSYSTVYFSHEYMGIASCLAIYDQKFPHEQMYFHAHEISTARAVTEKIAGHDVSFYHLIDKDLKDGISLEERFGSQRSSSRNELIKLTPYFDGVLAVGDWVKKEYQYLVPSADKKKLHICYNGIPVPDYSFEEKKKARKKLQTYCETLFNYTPDIIMTHVTRLVVSKGLWRDISLMEELDKKLAADNLKGFCVILSTLIGNGRTSAEVMQMEEDYGWPVLHKEGYPDLLGYENDVYWSCQYFNAKSRAIKVVFINQFGFTPYRVGKRLPDGTTFADLRLASDAEFGMSVYEPFGIAQIETIPFGGVAILTKACGSAFLLENTFKGEKTKPFFVFDFATDTPEHSNYDWLTLSADDRVQIEKTIIRSNIDKVYKTLPKTEIERENIYKICKKHLKKLSWNEVIKAMPFFK